MAREWWTGIEMGDLLEWDTVYTGGSSTITVTSSTVRSGTYALALNGADMNCYVQHNLATAVSELYVRVGYRYNTDNTHLAPAISFLDTGGAELGTLYVGSGNVLHADIGGTDVATGATTMQAGTWYLLEARLKVDDSAGVFQVRVDGSSEISFSGDTKPGSTTTIGYVRHYGGVHGVAGSAIAYIDDIAINDTTGTRDIDWPGEGHVAAHTAAANGTYTGFSIGGSSPPANAYQAVDDIPANDTVDYVYTTATGDKSTFTSAASGLSAVTIKHVAIEARCAESAATGETLALMIRNNGTDHVGTYTALTTSFTKVFREDYPQNPDTSSDWTVNAMDNLEFGVIAG